MIYELIKLSNDYGASFTPLLGSRLKGILLDYERGYEVDKDEIIERLIFEFIGHYEEINAQLKDTDLNF